MVAGWGIQLRSWLGRSGTFWVLLVGVLLLRVVFLILNARTPLVSDALYYDGVANAIVQGYDFEPYWPPGLTHYLALWKSLLGFDPWVSRLAMLPWFLALVFGLRSILLRLSGHLPANLAVLVIGVFPAFIHHSVEPLSQLPTAALLTLAFDQYLRFREHRSLPPALLAGVFLAVATLFRPSALLLAALWPLWCTWRRPRFAAALIPIGLIIPLSLNYISQRHDRFIFFNDANARNLYLGNTPWTDWYKTWYFGSHWTMSPLNPPGLLNELEGIHEYPLEERNRAFWAATRRHIAAEPGMFLVRSASKVRTFFAADTFTGARLVKQGQVVGYLVLALDALIYLLVMALALRWLFLTPRPPRPFLRRDVVMLVLLYALPYFLSFSHPTYHMPMFPIWLAMGALSGTAWLTRKEGEGVVMGDPIRGTRRWRLAVLVLVLIELEWVIQMSV